MAIDNKYGRVRFDEANTIGEDEPVVVFRAADPLLGALMNHYELLCAKAGSPDVHLNAIMQSKFGIATWQARNPDQVRPLPTSSNWDGRNRLDDASS